MLNSHYYNKTIRKLVSAFGSIFNNITLVAYNNSTGAEISRIKVPLTYAPKEKFIVRLLDDPTLNKTTAIELPRLSFEMTGLNYDSTRKLASMKKLYGNSTSNADSTIAVYNPVPYDFQFSLSIYTRNIEDGSQIIEQIVPIFVPDYTPTIDILPQIGIKKDIPVILNSVSQDVQYQGDVLTTRLVVYTLEFTVKAFLFSSVGTADIIRSAIQTVYDMPMAGKTIIISLNTGTAYFLDEEEVYIGNTYQSALTRGRVIGHTPATGRLELHSVTGILPKANDVIRGLDSGTSYTVLSTDTSYIKLIRDTFVVTPNTANIDSEWTVTETHEVYPDIT